MTIELGLAKAIDAQSFGQPGQRTFRLRVLGAASESASLWMEKEQFQALSMALGQVLVELRYAGQPSAEEIGEFPESPDHELKAGRMALGLDPAERTVTLYTYEAGEEDDEAPLLLVRLTPEQCAVMREQLERIIAGGRPVCPLCRLTIEESGHACIRGNGHSTAPIPREDTGEGT